MQDWITDDPMHFLRSMKAATQLHAEEFMTCTTCEQQPWFSFFFDGTENNRDIGESWQMHTNITRWMTRVFMTMTLCVLAACATGQPRGYVDVSAWGANYTEDYIQDFWIQTDEGKDTGVGGVLVSEFSRGGTSGHICCSLMPGVGKTIKVVWRVGGRQDDKSQWKTYSRDVVVKGAMPTKKDAYNILMVRFFSDHQVEVEVIPDRGEPGDAASPRVDKLFYGQRVMRHMGE
ncbi:DUF3304 domain-containing protein [Paraburkholderia kururiensis]|uniref:DUF3304 domain-containing protein n=1 Tax=Paraburkholderia kururiensis TaxID=984307 RepID=A0ABZ0WPR3_9BURK|nr:DUF3304 domain-containing protein [Paraburkholderia kururiensis]WQD79374.1 DUF3304 domain-containing protein [Paraburkholderia kururiensis]